MKVKLFVFFSILTLGIAYGIWDQFAPPIGVSIVPAEEKKTPSGDTVPNIEMTALDGKTYHLHDFKGKTLLINFWATWCPPCVAEFPHLLYLAQKYPDNFILIPISIDRNAVDIERFFMQFSEKMQNVLMANNVILIHDPIQAITRDTFKVYRYPESLIINPDLEIIKKIVGVVDGNDKRLHKMIQTGKPH